MSIIPATLKVADPYARTFYNVSINVGRSFEITRDFQNLEVFFSQTPDLIKYLENPLISSAEKKEIIFLLLADVVLLLYEASLNVVDSTKILNSDELFCD